MCGSDHFIYSCHQLYNKLLFKTSKIASTEIFSTSTSHHDNYFFSVLSSRHLQITFARLLLQDGCISYSSSCLHQTWLSLAKPAMCSHQDWNSLYCYAKFKDHLSMVSPLAKMNWYAAFCWPCEVMTEWMALMEGINWPGGLGLELISLPFWHDGAIQIIVTTFAGPSTCYTHPEIIPASLSNIIFWNNISQNSWCMNTAGFHWDSHSILWMMDNWNIFIEQKTHF